jgi:hypothetical protein
MTNLRIWLFIIILTFHAFSGIVTTQIAPGLDRPFRILTAGFDAVLAGMALLLLLRHRTHYSVRLFAVFTLVATVTVLLGFEQLGLTAQLNGVRQPFVFLSSLIILHDLLTSEKRVQFIRWVTFFLIFFTLAQIPASLWQYQKFTAGDSVGGTYGFGGSGIISQLLFLATFYLLVRHGSPDEGMTFSVKKVLLFSVLLVPCALNETKIAFVLLGVYILLLVGSRRKIYKAIPLLVVGAALAYTLGLVYSESVKEPEFLLDPAFYERYLVQDDTRPGADIPRVAKIALMFRSMGDDWSKVFFGYGYGLFAGENILGRTAFARKFWYFTGTRPLLFMIWFQGGLLAVLTIGTAIVLSLKKRELHTSTEKRFWLMLCAVLGSMWLYNDALWNRGFAMTVSYMMVWLSLGGTSLSDEVQGFESEKREESSDQEPATAVEPAIRE